MLEVVSNWASLTRPFVFSELKRARRRKKSLHPLPWLDTRHPIHRLLILIEGPLRTTCQWAKTNDSSSYSSSSFADSVLRLAVCRLLENLQGTKLRPPSTKQRTCRRTLRIGVSAASFVIICEVWIYLGTLFINLGWLHDAVLFIMRSRNADRREVRKGFLCSGHQSRHRLLLIQSYTCNWSRGLHRCAKWQLIHEWPLWLAFVSWLLRSHSRWIINKAEEWVTNKGLVCHWEEISKS